MESAADFEVSIESSGFRMFCMLLFSFVRMFIFVFYFISKPTDFESMFGHFSVANFALDLFANK